jgi:hypothetical protein
MELTIGILKKIIKDLPDDAILADLQIGNDKFHAFTHLKRVILLKDITDNKEYLTINSMGSHFNQKGEQSKLVWGCKEWNEFNIDK